MAVNEIIHGWVNYFFESEEVEKLALQRAKECSLCPHKKHGKVLGVLNDKIQEIESHYCGLCGCPLSPKLRSKNEKCEIGKW